VSFLHRKMNFISLFSSFVFLCVNIDVVGAVGLCS
jgi:hypothetical protein